MQSGHHSEPTATHDPIPLLDLSVQLNQIRDEVTSAIARVLESQEFILGHEVEALEKEIADFCGCSHAVGLSSGTDALVVSLMSVGVRPGDEVITTPFTFVATAAAISRVGAKPVFVDIDPRTFNITARNIEAAVTPRTRAILPAHLFGQMVDMEPISHLARQLGVVVIEDAAQAIGAEYHGKKAGSFGAIGCLSFFPSKNLGGIGDGGMIVTSDPDLAERARILRHHGYVHGAMGGNFRLDTIQAAVLRVKLRHLDAWTRARRKNAHLYRLYSDELGLDVQPRKDSQQDDTVFAPVLVSGEADITLPYEAHDRYHVYNQFVIRCRLRDELRAFLEQRNVGTRIYYEQPLHLSTAFATLGYKAGDFPEAELCAREVLALPIYPELSAGMLRDIMGDIALFVREHTA